MKTEDRFSNRVDNYVKFRPHYPVAVYDHLLSEGVIPKGAVIADAGCGTGISSKLFLKQGHKVFGIDPNKNMLDAAAEFLNDDNFIPVYSRAENTSLENKSVDLVICAQAFHWFDKQKAKQEFQRILTPNGYVALMWNDRRTTSTDFLKVYEDFLQMFGTDYKEVNHKNVQDKKIFESFFGNTSYNEKVIYNYQDLDFVGLKGRVLSSSYMPTEEHPDFNYMLYCLKKIFQRYQENDKIRIEYDTILYYGRFDKFSTAR
ncbi:MAG: class I SAM-dependent methyltransferase [Bacteroidetes bacterium]|nr:class I SAM-dependent methyltransferase [Bacteroidota bacterium]